MTTGNKLPPSASNSATTISGASTCAAPSAQKALVMPITAGRRSSPSISVGTDRSGGSATTAAGPAAPALSQEHARRLSERGLNPVLCAQLGMHSVGKTLGFHYFENEAVHNTKLRRGKGNMPWAVPGKKLILWNIDSLREPAVEDEEVIITEGELDAATFIQAGFSRVVSVPNGAQSGEHGFAYLYRGAELHPDLEKFGRFVLATDGDGPGIACRDALAIRLGDHRCRWVRYPDGCKDANEVLVKHGREAVVRLIEDSRPMWTDVVASFSDIPDPPSSEPRYRTGISALDHHGIRITLPCFWPIIGPYSSGKSVLVRQLLVNFWRLHDWRSMVTAFEERAKPRFQRDLRRHLIDRPMLPDNPWTAEEIAKADAEIEKAFKIFQRPAGQMVTPELLLRGIDYAVKVYGLKVIAIDPMNEVWFPRDPGMSKTDQLGQLIMQLKDKGEEYGLCIICCAHTSKETTEKRLRKGALLTLNDGEDTRYWGTKADMGWVVWNDAGKGTLLNVDKIKDHETMGRPTLAELEMDRAMNRFKVGRMGYDLLAEHKGK